MKTVYEHKLTGEKYTAKRIGSEVMGGEMLTGVWFESVSGGDDKFMTDHQIQKMMKAV